MKRLHVYKSKSFVQIHFKDECEEKIQFYHDNAFVCCFLKTFY